MKKALSKRLVLNRETITALTVVNGGASSPCPVPPSQVSVCQTDTSVYFTECGIRPLPMCYLNPA
jgi:hypothetical protein